MGAGRGAPQERLGRAIMRDMMDLDGLLIRTRRLSAGLMDPWRPKRGETQPGRGTGVMI